MKKIFISLFPLSYIMFFCTIIVSGQEEVSHTWSKEEQDVFISECNSSLTGVAVDEQVKIDYCNCSLQKLEEKFPDPSELIDIEEGKVTEAIEPCVIEFVKNVETLQEVEHVEWPADVQNAFLKECRAGAGESISDKDLVDRYCKCSLRKLETAHPDPEEMENISEDRMMEIINPCIEALTKELERE